MLDFPGFGRVIERGELDEDDEGPSVVPKQFDSPTAHSALSTGRDLSGRCLSEATNVDPGRVLASEAQSICKSVLSELLTGIVPVDPSASRERAAGAAAAMTPREEIQTPKSEMHGFDLARIEVTSSECGCIRGHLQWIGLGATAAKGKEKVAFSLVEIRRGYTVIGETVEGPKLLSSLCWKLQSINGLAESRPAWIRRGDTLILEGPKWATKRLRQPLPPAKPRVNETLPDFPSSYAETPGRPSTVGSETVSIAAISARSASAAPLPPEPPFRELSTSTSPQIAKPSLTKRALLQAEEAAERGEAQASSASRNLDFEVVQASPSSSSRGYSEGTPSATRSAKAGYEKPVSEATDASGSQPDRPAIPILDLNAVGKRRERKKRDNMAQDICAATAGCNFGWVECNMIQGDPRPRTTGKDVNPV